MADEAAPVLSACDVARQVRGEPRQPREEGVAEQHGEAGEDDHRPQGHDGDGDPPPLDPSLDGYDERVDQHGDEGRREEEEHDVADRVEQLAAQIDDDADGRDDEDRRQRHAVGRGATQHAAPDLILAEPGAILLPCARGVAGRRLVAHRLATVLDAARACRPA